MPDPPRPDGYVSLARAPFAALRIALHQRIRYPGAIEAGVRHALRVDRAPACGAGLTAFVADPANVWAGIAEDNGVRLHPAHGAVDARPVVGLALAIRAFAIRAVEPDFDQFAVAGQQLFELRDVEIVVGLPLPVRGCVAIPRRQVEADAQAFRPAGIDELAHDVPLAIAPRAVANAMLGGARGPETEAI